MIRLSRRSHRGGRALCAAASALLASLAVAASPAAAQDAGSDAGEPVAAEPGAGQPRAAEPEAAKPVAVTRELHRPGLRSYFAFVERRTRVRARPAKSSRAVAALRTRTADGTDELVVVLARHVTAAGDEWLKVRLSVLPNNSTGWVPASAMSSLQPVDTWLRIDVRRLRISLVKNMRVVFRARIGVGQNRWPTPLGEFYIRYRLTGYGSAGSFYGPVAFATSARSETLTDWPGGGVVGIHGTSLPQLLPGRVSHGCVRMRNQDIVKLARLMPVGTPVTVH